MQIIYNEDGSLKEILTDYEESKKILEAIRKRDGHEIYPCIQRTLDIRRNNET